MGHDPAEAAVLVRGEDAETGSADPLLEDRQRRRGPAVAVEIGLVRRGEIAGPVDVGDVALPLQGCLDDEGEADLVRSGGELGFRGRLGGPRGWYADGPGQR